MTKKLTAVLLTALSLSLVPVAVFAAGGLTDALVGDATAHIGSYLGGEKGGNAGTAIGGAIGTVTGIVVGSYIGSSMGPAGTVLWGWRTASFARTVGGIVGGA